MKGFCTKAFLLAGKSLNLLEVQLGYSPGRLKDGATIFFLEMLPLNPDDFELAGYTHFSGGAFRGQKMESLLESQDGLSKAQIRALKQKMIGTTIVVSGHERLAKLVPKKAQSPGESYPAGPGIFQINIVRPLWFVRKAEIGPGKQWFPDYSSPRS
jgi:hypothetical protein